MTLKNRYNQIMGDIKVTEEMHDRIMKNIDNADFYVNQKKVINSITYKKYMVIAACFILVVSAVVLPDMLTSNIEPPVQQGGNDMVEYATIEKLSDAVGFPIPKINKIPFTVKQVTYTAYGKELGESVYENNGDTIIFRKSVGKEDNSGNYNEYSNVKDVLINKHTITLKGNSNRFYLAIWQKSRYSYSLQSSAGVSEAEMLDMLNSIK